MERHRNKLPSLILDNEKAKNPECASPVNIDMALVKIRKPKSSQFMICSSKGRQYSHTGKRHKPMSKSVISLPSLGRKQGDAGRYTIRENGEVFD